MANLILVILSMTLLLSGCKDPNQDARNFINSVKQEPAQQLPPLPEIREYHTLTYSVPNNRDPFQITSEYLQATTQTSLVQQPRPDATRTRELLENYSLDSITMVGTIKKGANFWGIIKDKNGFLHRVQVGNYLGENSGKIEQITEKNMIVTELLTDGKGGWVNRQTTINLAK